MKSYSVHRPICSNCSALERTKQYCEEHNRLYQIPQSNSIDQRLMEYWHFLIQGRADNPKPIWEAFFPIERLLKNGQIGLNCSWDQLECYRIKESVRFKASLYVYMDFLGQRGLITSRDSNRYQALFHKYIKKVDSHYQDIFAKYLICVKKRN
jgi:hypothetical protein